MVQRCFLLPFYANAFLIHLIKEDLHCFVPSFVMGEEDPVVR